MKPSTGDFVTVSDYERGEAERAGSAMDFLLCAVATGRNCPTFTSDGDFKTFGGVFPIRLHGPRPVNR
jgi:hypothetical protein